MSYVWGSAREPAVAARTDAEGRFAAATAVDEQRLVDELAPRVGLWQRMIDRHRPDRSGHCRQCAAGAGQGVATPWPCAPYGIAESARRRHQERPG